MSVNTKPKHRVMSASEEQLQCSLDSDLDQLKGRTHFEDAGCWDGPWASLAKFRERCKFPKVKTLGKELPKTVYHAEAGLNVSSWRQVNNMAKTKEKIAEEKKERSCPRRKARWR